MPTTSSAYQYEKDAHANLAEIAEHPRVSPEAAATAASAMAMLAVSHRIADLIDFLAERMPQR